MLKERRKLFVTILKSSSMNDLYVDYSWSSYEMFSVEVYDSLICLMSLWSLTKYEMQGQSSNHRWASNNIDALTNNKAKRIVQIMRQRRWMQ